jgi:hypothetical protein
MQVNLKKLDARIEKLQEIRRIASDPELVSLLLEFLSTDDERREAAPTFRAQANAPAPSPEDIQLVDKVLKGMDPQLDGTWSAKRAKL